MIAARIVSDRILYLSQLGVSSPPNAGCRVVLFFQLQLPTFEFPDGFTSLGLMNVAKLVR